MAVNNERSMNHDLMLGMTGRTLYHLAPDRGGVVETEWPTFRAATYQRASWGDVHIAQAQDATAHPERYVHDAQLRERVSIVTGPSARTRPVARNQFEANPYPTPLDAVHTSWPDSW